MLALAEDDLGIEPDYNLSCSSLSNEFAMRSLLNQELTVLHASGLRPGSDSALKSFAPNLADGDHKTKPLNDPLLQFSAGTIWNPVHKPVTAATDNSISISGVRIDSIKRFIDVRPEAHLESEYERFAHWFGGELNIAIPSPVDTPGRAAAKSRRYDGVIKPLPGAIASSLKHRFAQLMDLTVDKESWRLIDYKNGELVWRMSWLAAATQQYLINRSVFQCFQGYLGLGPSWMQPDDQVVIFDGGATPFILRRVDNQNGGSSHKWQLVGDCYLLGWMGGNYFGYQVVDELPQEDDKLLYTGHFNRRRHKGEYLVRESFVLC
jgi:hypothetical protein